MKDKAIGIILLLFLFIVAAGNYLDNGIAFEQANLFGLVDLLISSFVLMIVPLCFRIKNKDLLSYEKGKKICAYNSWIILGISFVIMMIYEGFKGLGIVGALCYYFINMAFFTYPKDYKKEEGNIKVRLLKPNKVDKKNKINDFNENKDENCMEIKLETKYCTYCGKEIKDNWNFCNHCGNNLK